MQHACWLLRMPESSTACTAVPRAEVQEPPADDMRFFLQMAPRDPAILSRMRISRHTWLLADMCVCSCVFRRAVQFVMLRPAHECRSHLQTGQTNRPITIEFMGLEDFWYPEHDFSVEQSISRYARATKPNYVTLQPQALLRARHSGGILGPFVKMAGNEDTQRSGAFHHQLP